MSKGPWRRCGVTGVPVARLPEEALDDKGDLDVRRFSDCNVWGWAAIGRVAFPNMPASRARRRMERDPGCHRREFKDERGRVVEVGTHVNSAAWFGARKLAEARARSDANLAPFSFRLTGPPADAAD